MSLATRNNGCYECCKRRLKCDKSEPECLKCVKKGLKCSGQGLRCRFSRHMGRSQPETPTQITFTTSNSSNTSPLPSTPRISVSSAQTKSKASRRSQKGLRWIDVGGRLKEGHSTALQRQTSTTSIISFLDENRESSVRDNYSNSQTMFFCLEPTLRAPPDESLHPQARMLFNHFSEFIAPVMVVLDSLSNGYRDIILPLACQDEVLGRAVSVVSAFHLAQKAPDLRRTAEVGHHAIVEKLRRDSLRLTPSELFNPYTLATILVLLVGETITGANNYVYLLEMLSCIIQSPDCIPALPTYLSDFFLQQVKMFELFGFPLANESKGIQTLTKPADEYLLFISYPQLTEECEHYSNVTLMRGAIRDACGIYRRRAESSLDQDESIHIIEQLQQKVLRLKSDTKGAHALVWTYFIAAAESILPEHREFFSRRLAELHEYTGFGCIPAALEALGTIWGMQGVRRWTEIVANDIPILVM